MRVLPDRMPRLCTVCHHPKRTEINRLLVANGDSSRGIARQFGLDDEAVRRHSIAHLSAKIVRAADARTATQAEGLLDRS